MHNILPQKGRIESRHLFKFLKTSYVGNGARLQWKTNRKSYVAYQMTPVPMLSNALILEGPVC